MANLTPITRRMPIDNPEALSNIEREARDIAVLNDEFAANFGALIDVALVPMSTPPDREPFRRLEAAVLYSTVIALAFNMGREYERDSTEVPTSTKDDPAT